MLLKLSNCSEVKIYDLCISRWMEACLDEDLPPTTELEQGLRNGVFLGKLANFFAPKMVSEKRIYDRDQSRYKVHFLFFVFKLQSIVLPQGRS